MTRTGFQPLDKYYKLGRLKYTTDVYYVQKVNSAVFFLLLFLQHSTVLLLSDVFLLFTHWIIVFDIRY